MARLRNPDRNKLDTRIVHLRREVLRAERVLARETAKRAELCECAKFARLTLAQKYQQCKDTFEFVMELARREHAGKLDAQQQAQS